MILPLLHAAAYAQGPLTDEQKTQWKDLKPDMATQTVKRVTDRYPLSDQKNEGKWVKYAPMSDEFNGNHLDTKKWWPVNPEWKGRQPGWFDPDNVVVKDGCLQLTARKAEPVGMPKSEGYHTYTTAAVKSKENTLYGYYEVRAQAMNSAVSSSFWFTGGDKERASEIDVFEIGGKSPGYERKMNITMHVWRTPEYDQHWGLGSFWLAPTNLADDFHVYGLDWDEKTIKVYCDGALVRTGPNTHWHQALTLNFDSETMPEWFGLPKDEDLPSTFRIDYVRTWKRSGNAAGVSGPAN
jgi:beta-glucanase (GH16 family)